jgi:hypothetical protein
MRRARRQGDGYGDEQRGHMPARVAFGRIAIALTCGEPKSRDGNRGLRALTYIAVFFPQQVSSGKLRPDDVRLRWFEALLPKWSVRT